jgi:hypothetical protein
MALAGGITLLGEFFYMRSLMRLAAQYEMVV